MVPAIDLLNPSSFADGQPHEQFAWLRENAPVYRHPEPNGPGFWAVTRHGDVKAVGRDPGCFSSGPTIMIEDAERMEVGDHQMMLMMDPPRHTTYRRLMARDFTPRAAARMQSRIDGLARRIVDAVIERGECDLVADIAGELPSYVVADLLGLPLDDGRRLYALTETIHTAPSALPSGAIEAAVGEMFAYASGVIERKRADPGDDLSSMLLAAEVDGHRMDDLDFCLFFLLLVDAGGDTTRNLVAGGMQALFDNPTEHTRLRTDLEGLLPSTVEEMLRFVSPVIYMRRTATRDAEIQGQAIRRGDKVVMYYGSANRDERVFQHGDRFDVGRAPNDHVAFGGGGPHFCLGAHLARIEIKSILRELVTRVPDIAPAGPIEWLASNFISGPKHLPVRFSPGRVAVAS